MVRKARMDLYDRLPREVREAMGEALVPFSAEYMYNMMQEGASVAQMVDAIRNEEMNQHRGAAIFAKVVPAAPAGFKIRPWRKPRRIRR